jgi:hypothetical protein
VRCLCPSPHTMHARVPPVSFGACMSPRTHVPVCSGNVAAVFALAETLLLCVSHLNTGPSVVFLLVPILLLLNQDTGLFSSLTDKQRYFPLVAVSVCWLISVSVFQLVLRRYLEQHRWIPRTPASTPPATTLFVLKNLCLLAITLPGLSLFCSFMRTFKHTRDLYWILLLPLNVFPAFLSDIPSTRLLAVLCIVAGCLQLFLSDRIRKYGLQFV